MTDVTVVGCTSCGTCPAVVAGLCVQCATTALAERNALENRVDDLLHDIGVFAFAGIWVDGRDAERLRDPDTTELYVALQNTGHQYLELRDQRDAAQAAQAKMVQAALTLLAATRAVLASADYDPDQARVDPDALEVLEVVCAAYPAVPPKGALPCADAPATLEYLDSPTEGLDTKVVCGVCGQHRSVRFVQAISAWPQCCGQRMDLLDTRAQVRIHPDPDPVQAETE